MGVIIHENSSVKKLIIEEGSKRPKKKVVGIVTEDDKRHLCDHIIVCAGAWTPFLVPSLEGLLMPTGQPLLLLKVPHPSQYEAHKFPPFFGDINTAGFYGFCINNGVLKIGHHGKGIPYKNGQPLVVPESTVAVFDNWLSQHLPLSNVPRTSRLCLYCDAWDGNFYIDFEPNTEGLLVACGGSGHGFKFAPVLGKIIADVFEKKTNPYARLFRWREKSNETLREASRSNQDILQSATKSKL